eukprot:TRINITY_DN4346_c0_g1_i1.p1 TRINITY_DN4346_c0_g1~~TRINITY_DN4346_c0_g1_i1.p1  ORF type:complete len:1270 (+),score=556.96 TRINITY_DN4346_c0_g1_i1:72-3881(+)
MMVKFETKSNRVKGLSFHPCRPWILASLHSGVIQLWDYRIKTLLDRFDEHDGPVRGVCFHLTQPLFVSGGDDYKIKVWNYKQRRCLFTLTGHLDYIRTVQFHHEYPWVLSCSDDQTIRIWNWQSRTCIAVLTGHNHYVMSANFHPKDDLVVSASLDQTVRVWDISGLRKKNVTPAGMMDGLGGGNDMRIPANDLFGNNDVGVKYVLEGHDRGVNWAAFHPTLPLIISGADDRQLKLWRMNETKAWEVDTLRGHFNNVSCVLFHPRQELIISDSEDKSIRVWDMSKRIGVQSFRREHDRFWMLAAHPELNLFAAGHDTGLVVFKLEKERPAYTIAHGSQTLLFVKDRYIRMFDFGTGRDLPLIPLRRLTTGSSPAAGATGSSTISGQPPIRNISYNAAEKAILISSDAETSTYELYIIPKDARNTDNLEPKKGFGISAVFVARNRFVVFDKSHQLHVKNLQNDLLKKYQLDSLVDGIFPAYTGCVLLRCEDRIWLLDVQQKKHLAELVNIPQIKSAIWSPGEKQSMVALIGKEVLILANRKLEQLCTIHEVMSIKSGAWVENPSQSKSANSDVSLTTSSSSVFFYNTANQLKYCLVNGDSGVIRTLDIPVYITAVRGNKVYCLDREGKNRVLTIDPTEYTFKLALLEQQYSTALKMVRESSLMGQAIIAYLQKKGFPKFALHFVQDPKIRFNLALECGNIDIALESAKVIDNKECWSRLAKEALRQGNHQVVEWSYQRTMNFEGLSFLYTITGNFDKLRKMQGIAERRNDPLSRFHNSLFVGDVEQRVKILVEFGQLALAYALASSHGLEEQTSAIAEKLAEANIPLPAPQAKATLLTPPTPIIKNGENWPLLATFNSGPNFQDLLTPKTSGAESGAVETKKTTSLAALDDDDDEEAGQGDWGDDDIKLEDDEEVKGDESDGEWNADDDDDEIDKALADVNISGVSSSRKAEGFYVPPTPGPAIQQSWISSSKLAVDHVAAGSFDSAMLLLNQQVGFVNFEPLKKYFINIYTSSTALVPGVPGTHPLSFTLHTRVEGGKGASSIPVIPYGLTPLIEIIKAAYTFTNRGKFADAISQFLEILYTIPLLIVETKQEAAEVNGLIALCKEYVLGLKIELHRKEAEAKGADVVRLAELAAYFTHCNLQPSHLMQTLKSAMNAAFKAKNYLTSASFARRLLDLNPKGDIAIKAKKVIQHATTNAVDNAAMDYSDRNPFETCAISFKPIFKGSPSVKCPYCLASFEPQHKGKVCSVCSLAQIGADASGIQVARPTH